MEGRDAVFNANEKVGVDIAVAGAFGLVERFCNLFDDFEGDVVDLLLVEPVANPAAL